MQDIKKNLGGRPFLTNDQKKQRKEYLLIKLEPYLKSGLSINKALREAKVFNSEFYKYLSEDRLFGEKIALFKQYIPVLVNQIIVTELFTIIEKQNGNKAKGIKPQALSYPDIKFLWWFAINANVCQEEWGKRENISLYDPQIELQKINNLIQASRTG